MIPLVSLFPSAITVLFLLFASPPSPESKITPIIEARDTASALSLEGKHQEAIMWYEDAIMAGRRVVMQGMKKKSGNTAGKKSEEGAENIDGDGALSLLIELYRSSAWNRLAVPDIDGARREAWAACIHSQTIGDGSGKMEFRRIKAGAQAVMAAVSRAGDNPIGEMEAMKNLLELASGEGVEWESVIGDGSILGENGDGTAKSTEAMKNRIDELEKELQKRFGS